jgi:hypothetical protein
MSKNGQVFVFNLSGEDLIDLSLNGGAASPLPLPAWPMPHVSDAPFQPNCLAVPRVLNASDGLGKFFSGDNIVRIQWELPHTFHIDLTNTNDRFPVVESLALFVTSVRCLFLNQNGTKIYDIPLSDIT